MRQGKRGEEAEQKGLVVPNISKHYESGKTICFLTVYNHTVALLIL